MKTWSYWKDIFEFKMVNLNRKFIILDAKSKLNV